MRPFQQIPLVGPGSELQLTLDGRAVPHADVVRAADAADVSGRQTEAVPGAGLDSGSVPKGQTRL